MPVIIADDCLAMARELEEWHEVRSKINARADRSGKPLVMSTLPDAIKILDGAATELKRLELTREALSDLLGACLDYFGAIEKLPWPINIRDAAIRASELKKAWEEAEL